MRCGSVQCEPSTLFGGSFSPHRGVVFWVPRRVCGACPSRPGRWCQAERDRWPATMIRLDTTGPACFRQAHTWRGTQNTRRPQAAPPPNNTTQPRAKARETKPNRRGPQPHSPTAASPHAVVPAGGRPLTLGAPQTLPAAARPNVCAVTRTHARSCPAPPPDASATRLAQANRATSEVIEPCATHPAPRAAT